MPLDAGRRTAKLAKELLEWSPWQEGRQSRLLALVGAGRLGLLIDFDTNRNDRGLYLRDQVGKAGRTKLAFRGLGGRPECAAELGMVQRTRECEGKAYDRNRAQ